MSRSFWTVWLLGLTQVIGYGTIYYCFAILANDVAQEFGWSQADFFGCFSLSLAAGGVVTPFVGKAFDRFGAARLMAMGSGLVSITMLGTALAPSAHWFLLGMVATQVVATLVLYDAAFTTLVQLSRGEASRRIAYLTLIAGFASSVFWPLTTIIDDTYGWRVTLASFAAMNFFVSGPVHLLLWHWSRKQFSAVPAADDAQSEINAGSLPRQYFGKVTLLMTMGFVLSSIALSAVLGQMVPMLQSLGFGVASLWVATLFGPAQVVVRFTNIIFGSKRHPLAVTLLATALLPLGLVVAAISSPYVAGAVVAIILVGMSSGLKSIVQGTLPLELFGSAGYGARLGLMASFRYVAAALSPFGFAAFAERFDAATACLAFAGIGVAGVACFVGLGVFLKRVQSEVAQTAMP